MVTGFKYRAFTGSLEPVDEPELDDFFRDYLEKWMRKHQLSQADVAKGTEKSVPKERLSEAFNGKRKVRLIWIIKIAEAFGESPFSVFSGLAAHYRENKKPATVIPRGEDIDKTMASAPGLKSTAPPPDEDHRAVPKALVSKRKKRGKAKKDRPGGER